MKDTLLPGLKVDFTYRVSAERTVFKLLPESPEFDLMPEMLATGYMVALFEWACILPVNPNLDWPEGQTVGIHVDLSHVAATPPRLTVQVRGELTRIEGRKLTFALEVDDGVDVISRGIHERAVIQRAKFGAKMEKKARAAAQSGKAFCRGLAPPTRPYASFLTSQRYAL